MEWKQIGPLVFQWESKGRFFTATVKQYNPPRLREEKWEIIINDVYLSRDKGIFFDTAVDAFNVVERKLLPGLITILQQEVKG